MAYRKFTLNFTLIDPIVYEIITIQFTQPSKSASLTQLWISFNLSGQAIKNVYQKRIVCTYIGSKKSYNGLVGLDYRLYHKLSYEPVYLPKIKLIKSLYINQQNMSFVIKIK